MTVYMDAAQSLLECYRSALTALPAAIVPAKISLRHGDQVVPDIGTQEDECCTGVAWVRIVSVDPLRTFDDASLPCVNTERRVVLEMGAVSCKPFGTVENPISADAWDVLAVQQDAYHGAMEDALCCAYDDLANVLGVAVQPGVYEPGGPDGNCVSGTMQVIVETACGCTAGG